MEIGERIKLARKRLGMTQPVLGEAVGVTYQAVSGWERGEDSPSADKIPALRQKLRVTYAWLLTGQDSPPEPEAAAVLLDDQMSQPPPKPTRRPAGRPAA